MPSTGDTIEDPMSRVAGEGIVDVDVKLRVGVMEGSGGGTVGELIDVEVTLVVVAVEVKGNTCVFEMLDSAVGFDLESNKEPNPILFDRMKNNTAKTVVVPNAKIQ